MWIDLLLESVCLPREINEILSEWFFWQIYFFELIDNHSAE